MTYCSLCGRQPGYCRCDQIGRIELPPPPPAGCVCPPTSEQTCQSLTCPRKPPRRPAQEIAR